MYVRKVRDEVREYAHSHNFYKTIEACRFSIHLSNLEMRKLVPVSLSGLEYVAKYITYALRHDAWPKSLVPIPSSVCVRVYVCPRYAISVGRIEKKTKQKKE